MDTIILAGGRGTRLKSVIPDLPKSLAPLNGVPFLDILLGRINLCPRIQRVILAIGYRGEMIVNRYKRDSTYNFIIRFSKEIQLLGTGGAVKKALSQTKSDDVIVQNGDTFVEIDYQDLIDTHLRSNSPLTIVLIKVPDTARYGAVKIDRNLNILAFREKSDCGGPGFINAGLYIFQRNIFDDIANQKTLSLEKDLLPNMIKPYAHGYIAEGRFIDIGIPETYQYAEQYLKEV